MMRRWDDRSLIKIRDYAPACGYVWYGMSITWHQQGTVVKQSIIGTILPCNDKDDDDAEMICLTVTLRSEDFTFRLLLDDFSILDPSLIRRVGLLFPSFLLSIDLI